MKKTFFPIATFLLLSIVFFSCEKEQTIESTPEANLITTVDQNETGGEDDCCHEENMFERQLHWFSFLTAEILVHNAEIRSAFALEFGTIRNYTIPAEDLIGPNALIPSFDQEFFDIMTAYIEDGNGWPNSNQTPPPIPPVIGGLPGGNAEALTALYYTIILDDNCVELYLPNGFNLSVPSPEITTTAHPLTDATSNEGKHWHFSPLVQGYIWPPVVVNPAYTATNDNIFVARPVRNAVAPPSDPCSYTLYSGIDFTDFLD